MNYYPTSLRPIMAALLFFGFLAFSACKKESVPKPLDLAGNFNGNWYADLVTQSDIDITASNPYAFNITNDSQCVVERMWLGSKELFICTYQIDELNDRLTVEHKGAEPWYLEWKVMEADTVQRQIKFQDERASAVTYIHLYAW